MSGIDHAKLFEKIAKWGQLDCIPEKKCPSIIDVGDLALHYWRLGEMADSTVEKWEETLTLPAMCKEAEIEGSISVCCI